MKVWSNLKVFAEVAKTILMGKKETDLKEVFDTIYAYCSVLDDLSCYMVLPKSQQMEFHLIITNRLHCSIGYVFWL